MVSRSGIRHRAGVFRTGGRATAAHPRTHPRRAGHAQRHLPGLPDRRHLLSADDAAREAGDPRRHGDAGQHARRARAHCNRAAADERDPEDHPRPWGQCDLCSEGAQERQEQAKRDRSQRVTLETDAPEILQQYQDLSQLLRSRGLDVIALKCDNKKSWRLTIKNHVEIALGRDQVMEKMRRFVTVYDTKLNSVWTDVKAIDLRYSNGVAVRWVADSEMAKKYIKSQPQVGVAVPATKVLPQIN